MATYTDLMILLLTFFVLLLSLATIDKRKKRLALNSFVGAFGFKPGANSILGIPKGLNITVGTAPLVKEDIKFEMLRNVALKNNMDSEVKITKQVDRTILAISNRVLFKPGSHQLNPDSSTFLSELAETFSRENLRLIEIRGFTDHADIVFKEDPLKYSMYLSTKRANAVFNFLREKAGIPAKTMVAHGFGKALTGGQSAKKKSGLSRHAEIILDYREEIPYRLERPKRKSTLLDFKGFLFRVAGDGNELQQ